MRLRNKDIAKELSISTTAVSLALNNKPGVSDETRQKVLEMVRRSAEKTFNTYEHKQDQQKGSLLFSVHKRHGEVINDKPFFSDLVATAQQEAMRSGYTLLLANYLPGQDIQQYIDYLNTLPVRGMIIMATELLAEDLQVYQKLNLLIVLLDASIDLVNIDSVELDNQMAMYRAVDYAYHMGHRNIGYLQGETFIQNFGHHQDGYWKGLREHGLLEHHHPVLTLPCSIEGAYHKMKDLLAASDTLQLPTLFIAELDYLALGAMQAFREAGYHIPDDISFIGYDDVPASSISQPPLTTNRVNKMDSGRLAVERLIRRIEQPAEGFTTTQVASEFIVRQSVKNLKKQSG